MTTDSDFVYSNRESLRMNQLSITVINVLMTLLNLTVLLVLIYSVWWINGTEKCQPLPMSGHGSTDTCSPQTDADSSLLNTVLEQSKQIEQLEIYIDKLQVEYKREQTDFNTVLKETLDAQKEEKVKYESIFQTEINNLRQQLNDFKTETINEVTEKMTAILITNDNINQEVRTAITDIKKQSNLTFNDVSLELEYINNTVSLLNKTYFIENKVLNDSKEMSMKQIEGKIEKLKQGFENLNTVTDSALQKVRLLETETEDKDKRLSSIENTMTDMDLTIKEFKRETKRQAEQNDLSNSKNDKFHHQMTAALQETKKNTDKAIQELTSKLSSVSTSKTQRIKRRMHG